MDVGLAGKRALVTGSSNWIGAGIVHFRETNPIFTLFNIHVGEVMIGAGYYYDSYRKTDPGWKCSCIGHERIFYQFYFSDGCQAYEERIERARKASRRVLILTVDRDCWSHRERRVRERTRMPVDITLATMIRFSPQAIARPAWLLDYLRGRVAC